MTAQYNQIYSKHFQGIGDLIYQMIHGLEFVFFFFKFYLFVYLVPRLWKMLTVNSIPLPGVPTLCGPCVLGEDTKTCTVILFSLQLRLQVLSQSIQVVSFPGLLFILGKLLS